MGGILKFFNGILLIALALCGAVVLIDKAYEKYGRNYID